MKTIYDIARTELRLLFYSPIAWLIIIIFTFQTAIGFVDVFESLVHAQYMGYNIRSLTLSTFTGYLGLLTQAHNYLYLYIPLLTMGLVSKEYNSQSIKLLYSSPIKNHEIILGKYLSMMIFGLILIAILLIYVIYTCYAINNIDIIAVLTGLLGLYLLICAYSAIGLFMSSITSYQIIAAVGTLALLAILNMVGNLWQDIEFVRDLTYWLSINGRAEEMINGLICSEDIIYFLIVITLFILLSIIKLQSKRQKQPRRLVLQKYIILLTSVFFIGYLSSRPQFMTYYDATRTKVRTLTPNSQEIMKKLDEKITITTYVNMIDNDCFYGLPKYVNDDLSRFKQYTRFKPDLQFKYIYYYDTIKDEELNLRFPNMTLKEIMKNIVHIYGVDSSLLMSPQQIKEIIDLTGENNRFTRVIENQTGKKATLRLYDDMQKHPSESEISAALKRVAMNLPVVGFVTGHGERSVTRKGDRDYSIFASDKKFRYALPNQGFNVSTLNLNQPVPQQINILIIADLNVQLNPKEKENLDTYIARGGNLLIAVEPSNHIYINPIIEQLGARLIPGYLVKHRDDLSPDFMTSNPTVEAGEFSYIFDNMIRRERVVTMPGVAALEIMNTDNFRITPLFWCDSVNIIENIDDIENQNYLDKNNPATSYYTALALERQLGNNTQKIVIIGDADCLSNKEINTARKEIDAANYSLITGFFYWLSDEEVPIDIRRPETPDNTINISIKENNTWKIIFIGIFPLLLILSYLIIWFKRRGR